MTRTEPDPTEEPQKWLLVLEAVGLGDHYAAALALTSVDEEGREIFQARDRDSNPYWFRIEDCGCWVSYGEEDGELTEQHWKQAQRRWSVVERYLERLLEVSEGLDSDGRRSVARAHVAAAAILRPPALAAPEPDRDKAR